MRLRNTGWHRRNAVYNTHNNLQDVWEVPTHLNCLFSYLFIYLFPYFCILWLGAISHDLVTVWQWMWQRHTMPTSKSHFLINNCVLCDVDNSRGKQLFHWRASGSVLVHERQLTGKTMNKEGDAVFQPVGNNKRQSGRVSS
jgi:hypothetical protein